MRKKILAVAVSMAVLLGTALRPWAGVSVRDGAEAGQVVSGENDGRLHLNAAEHAEVKVVSVSLGMDYSGAVTEDGNLYMWGIGGDARLGDGTRGNHNTPVKVLENVRNVSLGVDQSGAVTEDGSLYMWGCNENDLNGLLEDKNVMKPVKVMENVQTASINGRGGTYTASRGSGSEISIGGHNAAVTKDGSLYMWGDNSDGRLGDGTTKNRNRPVKVLENVQTVSLGGAHSGAVTKDGSLYMWGDNSYNQIGEDAGEDCTKPVKVLENVQTVSLGGFCSGAVTKDGSLYMWGTGVPAGIPGEYHGKPVKVLENIQTVSLGDFCSGAVTKDGSLYMWGPNEHGELGDGTSEYRDQPVKVLENVQTVSLGSHHSGAVTKDGSLYMWGMNHMGQLGLGDVDNHSRVDYRDRPVKISSFSSLPVFAKASQKITYNSAAIKKGKVTYGSSFSLNAKTTGSGKLTYKSSNAKILSVNTKGRVTVKGYGPVSIKIKASGGNGYKAAVRKIKLTAVPRRGKVTKAVQESGDVRIRWKPEKTADGYEYAFAYNKKFSGQIRKKTSKNGLILTKYKTGTKKIYFKVRTYKKAGKKTCYGSWSKVRLLKLKKVPKAGKSSYTIAS